MGAAGNWKRFSAWRQCLSVPSLLGPYHAAPVHAAGDAPMGHQPAAQSAGFHWVVARHLFPAAVRRGIVGASCRRI